MFFKAAVKGIYYWLRGLSNKEQPLYHRWQLYPGEAINFRGCAPLGVIMRKPYKQGGTWYVDLFFTIGRDQGFRNKTATMLVEELVQDERIEVFHKHAKIKVLKKVCEGDLGIIHTSDIITGR
jgi:hypothetical protein